MHTEETEKKEKENPQAANGECGSKECVDVKNCFHKDNVTALDMLDGIELYASACYDVTQMHLSKLGEMTTVEEVKNYDYTAFYPEKLSFG